PMADGFMQQNAGPAGTEHYRHATGRGRTRIQIDQRLMHGLLRIVLQYVIGEITVIESAATAGCALLSTAILLGDDLDRQAYQRSDIRRHDAIVTCDHDHFIFAGNRSHDLAYEPVSLARKRLQPLEQSDLGIGAERCDRVLRDIELGRTDALYGFAGLLIAGCGNGAGSLGRLFQSGHVNVIRIGESSLFPADGTDADTLVDIEV